MSLSIIIPDYNGAKYLREAVDSALAVSGMDVEVIVVDDGSTDGSGEILESYKDRIRLFNQTNQGAGAARNVGLKNAKGEFVYFLDADDRVIPKGLQILCFTLEDHPNNQSMYGTAQMINEKGERTGKRDETRLPTHLSSLEGLVGQNLLTGRVVHRRENLLAVGGFDESLERGQEFDLHIRLALQGIEFLPMPIELFEYRIHQGDHRISANGFSGTDPMYFLKLNQKHLELLEAQLHPPWPEELRSRMAQRLWEIGRGLVREGLVADATIYFSEAKNLSPRNCIKGGGLYFGLVSLMGPVWVEKCRVRFSL